MTQRGRRRRAAQAACLAFGAVMLLGAATQAMAGEPRRDNAYQQWERMPPQQREKILREQERYRRLPPGEQERLRREYEQRHRN